jgi:very-short-patch-repair endonuclease
MFLHYKNHLKTYAQQNRKMPTESEWLVRNCFLKWDKQGYRFLRQKPLGWYILDFYCPKLKLCIEIDGESHEWAWEYDEKRDAYLRSLWIKTVRYKDIRVHKKLESVWLDIEGVVYERVQELNQNPPSG